MQVSPASTSSKRAPLTVVTICSSTRMLTFPAVPITSPAPASRWQASTTCARAACTSISSSLHHAEREPASFGSHGVLLRQPSPVNQRKRRPVCRYGEITLAPDTAAASRARAWLRDRLTAWQLDFRADDLLVVVSELVTNVVLHARSPIEITMSVGEGAIEVSVADTDDRTPQPRLAGEIWDEGGRGLALVSALSDDWGVALRSPGKQVWVRLPAPREWSYQAACACGRSAPGTGVSVASGHRIVDLLA